jgi:hypothetical protein
MTTVRFDGAGETFFHPLWGLMCVRENRKRNRRSPFPLKPKCGLRGPAIFQRHRNSEFCVVTADRNHCSFIAQ